MYLLKFKINKWKNNNLNYHNYKLLLKYIKKKSLLLSSLINMLIPF